MKPPVEAYTGKDPYVFVSYSHKDSNIVYKAIEQLCAEYFRIWYDEGIEPGRIWKDVLEQKIKGSHCVLAFISPEAMSSSHVIRELNLTKLFGKWILPVYLTQTNLPESISEYVSSFQAMNLETAESSGRWTKLIEALPDKTREFRTSEQQLHFLEEGLSNPLIIQLLREHTEKELGWCSIQKRGEPDNDFLQTCKMCGDTDWFEAIGLGSQGPSKSCASCGLFKDPGRAAPWFKIIGRDGENLNVTCINCGQVTTYIKNDGPPLICPKCGQLKYTKATWDSLL
jgi:hypothetical protein